MSKPISQQEADSLFLMEKIKTDNEEFAVPLLGKKISVVLSSKDNKEKFLLDVSSGRLNIARYKMQNRARETIFYVD